VLEWKCSRHCGEELGLQEDEGSRFKTRERSDFYLAGSNASPRSGSGLLSGPMIITLKPFGPVRKLTGAFKCLGVKYLQVPIAAVLQASRVVN
jgi:hypothetical protein